MWVKSMHYYDPLDMWLSWEESEEDQVQVLPQTGFVTREVNPCMFHPQNEMSPELSQRMNASLTTYPERLTAS